MKAAGIIMFFIVSEIHFLHSKTCKGEDEDLLRMQQMLTEDPASLERVNYFEHDYQNVAGFTLTPLMHATHVGHLKCFKFLLEQGANGSKTLVEIMKSGHVRIKCFFFHVLYFFKTDHRFEMARCLLNHGFFATTQLDRYHTLLFVNQQIQQFNMGDERSFPFVEILLKFCSKNFNFINGTDFQTLLLNSFKCFDTNVLPLIRVLLLYGASIDPIIQFDAPKKLALVVPYSDNPCAANKYLEVMKLYHAFSGDLNRNYCDILECVYRNKKSVRAFSTVIVKLFDMISNPMRLQDLARLAVRNCMGKNYMVDYDKLPLPIGLQSFMRFEDIEITEVGEH
jgi:hypothetical protein